MDKRFFSSINFRLSAIIFLILVLGFGAYIFVSTQYVTTLSSSQINDKVTATVALNVEKIDRQTDLMQVKAQDIASAAMAFERIKEKNPAIDMDAEIEAYVTQSAKTFPQALGGGIWYEPYAFDADEKYYGPYAYWWDGAVVPTWEYSNAEYDYFKWDWYTMGLPVDWDRTQPRPKAWYYGAPYYDETLGTLITSESLIYSPEGRILGTTTVDWRLQAIVEFLEGMKITEDTENFLLDRESGLFIANTFDKDLTLKSAESVAWIGSLGDAAKGDIKIKTLAIEGVEYNVYYTVTDVGMLYGVLIPTKTIFEPVRKMIVLNITLSVVFAIILIGVLYVSLYSLIVVRLRQLKDAAERVTNGDFDFTLPEQKRDDEISVLSAALEMLIAAFKTKAASQKPEAKAKPEGKKK
jgi:methyl-accepting chemotaxis protein